MEHNLGISAIADHWHALPPIEQTTGEGPPQKAEYGLFEKQKEKTQTLILNH